MRLPLPEHPSVGDALALFRYFGVFFFLDGLKIPTQIPINVTLIMETPWKFRFSWVKPPKKPSPGAFLDTKKWHVKLEGL